MRVHDLLKVVQLEKGEAETRLQALRMAPESVVLSTQEIYQVAGDTRLNCE